ncbi:MAG TPA: phospholipase D-like domain-containing protein [Ferruginibacter sp.]|nr:phospholipase D-like domain-containing protein [Ferruginibacter sp.]
MRNGTHNNKFSIHAISGNHVVTLGFDAKKAAAKNLLGFAVHRTELDKQGKTVEAYWMKGYKPFEEVISKPEPNTYYSTYEHPVQSFLWADFTVKPGKRYVYKIIPVSGKPKLLKYGEELKVEIQSEPLSDNVHEIHFNRGVAASQAYAAKFGKPVKKLEPAKQAEAYKWLSRGLEEAIKDFIGRAKDESWAIRTALYEIEYEKVAAWFKDAITRGVDVKIIYHAKKGETQTKENEDTLRNAGFDPGNDGITFPRTKMGNLMHCKFIVLLKNGIAQQVWTGSTNLTYSGIFGHSNVGHCIKDKDLANQYLCFWESIKENNPLAKMQGSCLTLTPDLLLDQLPDKMAAVFSPRKGYSMLDFYSALMNKAKKMACITLAFNMDWRFSKILSEESVALRYVLLNGKAGDKEIAEDYKNDTDVIVAPGSKMETAWQQFLEEMVSGLSGSNVAYIHNKFILVDPLSDYPIVVTGSANFSQTSTEKNDENMVYIPGDKRVADIYLGEFFRMFDHFYSRYINSLYGDAADTTKQRFLKSTAEKWIPSYYNSKTDKYKKRTLFSYGFKK